MKSLKRIFIYIVLLSLLLLIVFEKLLPDEKELHSILEIIIVLPIISYVFIPKFLDKFPMRDRQINLGFVYFGIMAIIMVIGNLNNFIVRFVYPSFGSNISITNYYWMGGMVTFSLGFLNLKYKNRHHKSYRPISVNLIIFLFLISLFATTYSIMSLGFIPFLSKAGFDMRFTVGETSIVNRLWMFSVITSILGFMYYFGKKKKKIILTIGLISLLISFFFFVRIYPTLIILTLFLYIFLITKNKKRIVLFTVVGLTIFLFMNTWFVNYRAGRVNNPVVNNRELSKLQKTIYFTFNEYRQLNIAINDYHWQPEKGKTLLGFPAGFIPQQLFAVFGIDKSKIQANNSAALMADFLNRESLGIRIGLLGEFYINFKFYGFLLMYFIGLFVGFLQKKINNLNTTDYRFAFYLLFYAITVYGLIGQINVIGSLMSTYFYLFLFLLIFDKLKGRVTT